MLGNLIYNWNFLWKKTTVHTHARTHTVFLNDNTSLYEFVSANKQLAHHLAVLMLTGFFLFCWGVDLWPEAVEEQGAGLVRSGTVDMDSNADVQWSSSRRQVSVTKIIQPILQSVTVNMLLMNSARSFSFPSL